MPPIRAASVRLIPSSTAASDSKRRLWLACLVAAASRRSSSAEKAVRTLMADGMARVLPAPWNQLSLQHKSPVSQKRLPLVSVPLAPDLADAVQHLAGDPILLHHCLPEAQSTQLALDYQGPNPVGGGVQQGGATSHVRPVRFGIKGAQSRQGLLDLAAQGSQRVRLLLEDLAIEHAPSSLSRKAGREAPGRTNAHFGSRRRTGRVGHLEQRLWPASTNTPVASGASISHQPAGARRLPGAQTYALQPGLHLSSCSSAECRLAVVDREEDEGLRLRLARRWLWCQPRSRPR